MPFPTCKHGSISVWTGFVRFMGIAIGPNAPPNPQKASSKAKIGRKRCP